jgi:dienelactone hydrolase
MYRIPAPPTLGLRLAPILLVFALATPGIVGMARAKTVAPPSQPASGPGGAERAYPGVIASRHGDRPTGFWLFEPAGDDGAPIETAVPLVIFLHGFMAVDPSGYRAWIDHIVRGGAVVVYPDYQTLNPLRLDPSRYLENTLVAVETALDVLAEPGRVPVDLDRVAAVGHSAGGVLSIDYAAAAEFAGLPVPNAVMPVTPGGCRDCSVSIDMLLGIPLEDLSTVDPGTYVIVVVADNDRVVGTGPGETIFARLEGLDPGRRDLVMIQTDRYGSPSLEADHMFPMTGSFLGEVDALDWYGLWQRLDRLMACAFEGTQCDAAHGDGEPQAFMGLWSDGTPVATALVTSG